MSYDAISGSGAIVCIHVATRRSPILRATRDEPLEEADSGWQFLCGASGHAASDAQVWRLDEVVAYDPSVRELLDEPPNKSFERNPVTYEWCEQEYKIEEAEQGDIPNA